MNITCVICHKSIKSEDTVDGTFCGHLFHSTCLYNSLKRSRTCPQCHSRMQEYRARPFYLHFSSAEHSTDLETKLEKLVDKTERMTDIVTMQFKILMRKRRSRQTEIKNLKRDLASSKKRCKKLKGFVECSAETSTRLEKEIATSVRENIIMQKRISELETMNKSELETVAEILSTENNPASEIHELAEPNRKMVRNLRSSARQCNNLETQSVLKNSSMMSKENTVIREADIRLKNKKAKPVQQRKKNSSAARAPLDSIDPNTENALPSKRYDLRSR